MNEYKRIFRDNPDGEEILKDLYQRFNNPARLDGGIDAILNTYYRAGQRDVLDYMVKKSYEGANED